MVYQHISKAFSLSPPHVITVYCLLKFTFYELLFCILILICVLFEGFKMNPSLKNKLQRKLKKYENILSREFNIKRSIEPSQTLMVCNVGVDNEISGQDIVEFFTKFGVIKNAVFIPNKSYSFVEFESVEKSEECFNSVNGMVSLDRLDRPIYLLYVDSLPSIKNDLSIMSTLPPGAVLIDDFLDNEEEIKFLSCSDESFSKQRTTLKQRQVYHYGYAFIYGQNTIDKKNPLPNGLPKICEIVPARLKEKGHPCSTPDQLTLNLYYPGQGIPPHIDTHSAFEDPILVLSVGSDCIMEFKKNSERLNVLLKRRSLLVLSGESRYAWTHGIAPRKSDLIYDEKQGLLSRERGTRVSFTFRKILKGECNCDFAEHCDSQSPKTHIPNDPVDLERSYVHEVYENISDHFSQTRYKPWPNVLKFVQSLPAGSILLDVGCGNGKYFKNNLNIFEVGCDYSSGLAEICKERGFEVMRSNCLYLPFKDGCCDGVISIAVLHHLSTDERRIKAIKEIVRVLQIGGKALIYVWAKEQKLNDSPSSYLKDITDEKDSKIASNVNLPVHVNRTDFTENNQDILVPWKLQGKKVKNDDPQNTFLRYYHVFKQSELEKLCQSVSCSILDSYYDNGNWCVILSKTF